MATIRQRPNGTFELRVVHRLLPKPYYSTHDSVKEAEEYAGKLKAHLDAGRVPPELASPVARPDTKVSVMLREYLNRGRVASSDRPVVCWLQESINTTVQGITVRWVDDWVLEMKRKQHLAPGTIRKRVESLARALDWWIRDTGHERMNPLRTLPRGYSRYAEGEAPDGLEARVDTSRDRRLLPGEQERIEAALLGVKSEGRQRALSGDDLPALLALFRLILGTGLRLREAYTLRRWQIQADTWTIHIERSKTGRARDVPMTSGVREGVLQTLSACPNGPQATIFPFWDGSPDSLERVTRRLSARFKSVFAYAGCEGLTEHDLRHEATCRWMMMKDDSGRWLFRPEEVRRITGHKNVQQFERYLSLRGSDLAERLISPDRTD